MINSVQIKNLRSLVDSGQIEIKPITVLLGANSTGKSTFLRSFPLLTQSVNKSLRGPISWFDSTLVDFGDFQTALNRFAQDENCIRFAYSFVYKDDRKGYMFEQESYKQMLIPTKLTKASFALSADRDGAFVKEIEIEYEGVAYKLAIDARKSDVHVSIADQPFDLPFTVRFLNEARQKLLPQLYAFDNKYPQYYSFRTYVQEKIEDELAIWCDRRFKNRYRLHTMLDYPSLDKQGLLAKMKQDCTVESLKKHINRWTVKNLTFQKIYNMFVAYRLDALISFCNSELASFYSNCSYIAPLRAEANRYYRNQELQVNDVDAYGRNLPEFISSLSESEKEDYDVFMRKILKVTPNVTSVMGLQSVVLQSDNGEFNMTDVGYGYSQILPVLTKIWYTAYKFRKPTRRMRYGMEIDGVVLLMEQPELHLHPALQAKVADAMVNYVKQRDANAAQKRIVVETHSQTIINRLGRRIREKEIKTEDINIVIFQKDNEGKNTIVKQISFNENGQLMDWPWGFFDPED